jgi:hypothetical protein
MSTVSGPTHAMKPLLAGTPFLDVIPLSGSHTTTLSKGGTGIQGSHPMPMASLAPVGLQASRTAPMNEAISRPAVSATTTSWAAGDPKNTSGRPVCIRL